MALHKVFKTLALLSVFGAVFSNTTDKEEDILIVKTKQGRIEGTLAPNGLYHEFLGIKYAEILHKFRAPVDPLAFEGVFKADIRDVICPQFPSIDPLTLPSDTEDCLVLNVFTPNPYGNTTLPVMLYIHGGDFGVGSGSPIIYGPQYLVSHGVVVVTINYRLNYNGFLNLGIKEAPGNAGLKDIRAALRWIRDNIEKFGGDKDNVTVFGEGTGGAAAIYLTLSETTKGLFHKVIAQSGCLFTPQTFDSSPLATASQLAKSLELNTENPDELLKLYTETPINKIEQAIAKQMNAKSVFLPSVENIFDDEEAFLTDTPYNILKDKDSAFNPVPILLGLNTVEGLTCTLDYNTITSQMDRIKNEDYSALDQRSLTCELEDKIELRKVLKETYFSNSSSEESIVGGIINMNTDFSFVGPMSLFTEMYGNRSSNAVFQYVFNYIGNRNLGRILTNSSLEATSNRDELFYLFELERLPLPMDENDARIVTFMTMMWANFAKLGTPTPNTADGEWLPYPHYLAIDLEPQYIAPLTPERAYFWRSLYLKYGAEITDRTVTVTAVKNSAEKEENSEESKGGKSSGESEES